MALMEECFQPSKMLRSTLDTYLAVMKMTTIAAFNFVSFTVHHLSLRKSAT